MTDFFAALPPQAWCLVAAAVLAALLLGVKLAHGPRRKRPSWTNDVSEQSPVVDQSVIMTTSNHSRR